MPPTAARIEKLTPQQEAQMPVVRDDWIRAAIGEGWETPDKAEVGQRLLEVFAQNNIKQQNVVVFDSPFAVQAAANLLCNGSLPPPWEAPSAARRRLDQGVGQGVWQGVGQGVEQGVEQGVGQGVEQGVEQGVWQGVEQGVGQGVGQGVEQGVEQGVGQGVWQGVEQGVRQGVEQGVGQGVWQGVWQGVRQGVEQGVEQGVRQGVEQGVWQGVGQGVWQGVGQGVEQGVWQGVEQGVWQGVEQGVWQGVGQGVRQGVGQGVWQGVEQGVWQGDPPQWKFYSVDWIGLSWSSGWLSFYDFFRRVGITPGERCHWDGFKHLAETMRLGVWDMVCLTDVVLVSLRPTVVTKDTQGRLHNATGPAVLFGDGYAQYWYHGVLTPGWVIEEPERLTAKLVLEEKNVEVRRVMVDVMGKERFLAGADAKEIDSVLDRAGARCRLLQINIGGREPLQYTEVTCPSTGKVTHERVPATVRTYAEARKWQFDYTEDITVQET